MGSRWASYDDSNDDGDGGNDDDDDDGDDNDDGDDDDHDGGDGDDDHDFLLLVIWLAYAFLRFSHESFMDSYIEDNESRPTNWGNQIEE